MNKMNKKFNSIRYSDAFSVDKGNEKRIEYLVNLVGANKTILDIGCGDGYISEMLINAGNDVSGIEISEKAVKKLKKKGIPVYEYDLNSEWSTKIHKKFDLVLGGEIIEHVFDTDLFLRNIHSVLKKGGELILTTPNIASFGRRIMLLLGINPLIETTARSYDAGHIRYFTKSALKTLLTENNFSVISITSDTVNFNNTGTLKSTLLARIFPTLGKTLIAHAIAT